MLKQSLLTFFVLLPTLTFAQSTLDGVDEIKLTPALEVIEANRWEMQNPSLSYDGQAVSFNATKIKFIPRLDITPFMSFRNADGTWSKSDVKIKKRFLKGYIGGAFLGDDNDLYYASYKKIAGAHEFAFYERQDDKYYPVKKFKMKKDFGLGNNIINHPKVSPDGRWLTFYTRGLDKRGIYLYNFETEEVHHISTREDGQGHDDKHPTWTADGKKILFHYQTGGNSSVNTDQDEQSYLGYYAIETKGNQLVSSTRVMIDDLSSPKFTYHKHAGNFVDTDYIVFHGKKKIDGSSKIYIRKMEKNSNIYEIELKNAAGEKFKKLKHPTLSMKAKNMVFLARTELEEDYTLYNMSADDVKKIVKKAKKKDNPDE